MPLEQAAARTVVLVEHSTQPVPVIRLNDVAEREDLRAALDLAVVHLHVEFVELVPEAGGMRW